jgi:dipeptidyl aminopeptidase/acylaminoacyl peptidase
MEQQRPQWPRYGSLCCLPARPPLHPPLQSSRRQWTVADWSADETKVAAVEYISINESYVHIIEVATGKTEIATPRRAGPQDEPVSSSDPKWSKDGRSLFYISDQGSEYRHLVQHILASGKLTPLAEHIQRDVEEFDLSFDGRLIAFVANDNGLGKIHLLDTNTGIEPARNPPRIAAGQFSNLKFQPGAFDVAFTFSSFRSSPDAQQCNLYEGPVTPWTASETGGLDASSFAAPELIEYPSFDGRKVPAFVYRPSPQKFPGPRPVLIDIHGGPEGQFRPSFLGRLNYWVSELGIVLIFPNVRGSSGYGKSYLKLDNGMKREDAVKDIGALLDWIGGQADLDKTRVGVTGGSYGGFMSLAVQTTYNTRIKAGIEIVGISNFVTFLQNTQGYRRDLRRAEYGDERDPAMRSFLERIAPLARAHMIHTPILIVQGQNDPRVPISEAEQMVAALKKNGVPLLYLVGTNEGHGFAKKVNQDYLQAVEVMFLRRYLLGEGGAERHSR